MAENIPRHELPDSYWWGIKRAHKALQRQAGKYGEQEGTRLMRMRRLTRTLPRDIITGLPEEGHENDTLVWQGMRTLGGLMAGSGQLSIVRHLGSSEEARAKGTPLRAVEKHYAYRLPGLGGRPHILRQQIEFADYFNPNAPEPPDLLGMVVTGQSSDEYLPKDQEYLELLDQLQQLQHHFDRRPVNRRSA